MARRSGARMTAHQRPIASSITHTNVSIVAESHAVVAFCRTWMLTLTQATTQHCAAQRYSACIDAKHLLQVTTTYWSNVDRFGTIRSSFCATPNRRQPSTVHLDFVATLERQPATLVAPAARLRAETLASMSAFLDQKRTSISTIGNSVIDIIRVTQSATNVTTCFALKENS